MGNRSRNPMGNRGLVSALCTNALSSDATEEGGGLYCYAYVVAQNAQIGHVM